MLALWLALVPPTLAQQADDAVVQDDDDEFDFLKEGDEAAARREAEEMSGDEFAMDDDEMAGFALAIPVPPKANLPAAAGMPLTDAYEPTLYSGPPGTVVVELPVLLAGDGDYWLIVELYQGETKVGEVRQWVSPVMKQQFSMPRFHVPVSDKEGAFTLQVSRQDDGAEAATALYTRELTYQLP